VRAFSVTLRTLSSVKPEGLPGADLDTDLQFDVVGCEVLDYLLRKPGQVPGVPVRTNSGDAEEPRVLSALSRLWNGNGDWSTRCLGQAVGCVVGRTRLRVGRSRLRCLGCALGDLAITL
jgi:hypothetical protein